MAWFSLVPIGVDNGLDRETNDRIHRTMVQIEAPMALAILAVIATLTVALAVVVSGLADPGSDQSQGIDEARRQFLTATVNVLGILGVTMAEPAVVWNAISDGFGLVGAVGLLLIASVISALAADSGTVLGRARSSDPAFACWFRENEVDRMRSAAEHDQQVLAMIDRRSRLTCMGATATLLAGVGLLLGVGLLAAFPLDLIHTWWSVPDRLGRAALAGLFVGGGVLFFGYRLSVHWLRRQWWSVATWIMLRVLFALALATAVIEVMGSAPDRASAVLPPTLICGPALVAAVLLALNFGPARLGRRQPWPRLVPNLRRLRGGEVWRRIDRRRRANAKSPAAIAS